MKKTIRIAGILLALVLVTSCFVGTTFAKYTYSLEDATDTARVAKWGVEGTVTGSAFATSYDLDAPVDGLTLAVESSTTDKVVAPGTDGTFTGIALTGTPEVAVEVAITADLAISGWNNGVADNPETVEEDESFYCPIIITVNGSPISGLDYKTAAKFEAAVEAAIVAANGKYDPNTDLSTVTNLNGNYTWAWALNGNDAYDTVLGDAAADGNAATITLTVGATVEQVG